jgi:hypothetical protein
LVSISRTMRPKNRATRLMTDIAGFKDASLRHLPAQFILRWWTADWFQPIAKVGERAMTNGH